MCAPLFSNPHRKIAHMALFHKSRAGYPGGHTNPSRLLYPLFGGSGGPTSAAAIMKLAVPIESAADHLAPFGFRFNLGPPASAATVAASARAPAAMMGPALPVVRAVNHNNPLRCRFNPGPASAATMAASARAAAIALRHRARREYYAIALFNFAAAARPKMSIVACMSDSEASIPCSGLAAYSKRLSRPSLLHVTIRSSPTETIL